MDRKTRASVAFALIEAAIAAEDQDCYDFVASIVDRERLYEHFVSDAGERIRTMSQFTATLEAESGSTR
jgi:hypothetical protein